VDVFGPAWNAERAPGLHIAAASRIFAPQPSFLLSSRTHNMLIPHNPAQYQAVSPPTICPVSSRTFTEKEPWSPLLVLVAAKLYSSSPASSTAASSGSWSPAINCDPP
jgi:hypothetical protein